MQGVSNRFAGVVMCMALACTANETQGDDVDASSGSQETASAEAEATTAMATEGSSTTAVDSDITGAEETGSGETGSPEDLEPWPSSGCGAASLGPGAHDELVLEHDGVERNYDVYVPQAHGGADPLPLVLNFHGLTSDSMSQEAFSQFDPVAEAAGVVAVYPEGIENSWNAGNCCGNAMEDAVDDVGFVRSLVATLGETVCIDERRIYATGMSNGGFLSYRLACEASDIFAAIAPVAAALGVDPESCNPERPVPAMHFHGTEDQLVPYDGGGVIDVPSASDNIHAWSERNGCAPNSAVTLEVAPVTCETWSGCEDGGAVVLCTAEGAGHCWPGQPECPFGDSTTVVDASEMMVEFFAEHPMP